MDYNNLDLRNKTIYDFTDNSEILDDLGYSPKEYFFRSLDETLRGMSLMDYAEYIHDEKLIEAVEKEFATEFSAFFNE